MNQPQNQSNQMMVITRRLLLFFAIVFSSFTSMYAYDAWGENDPERARNTIDALSEALCVDAVKDKTKISRETYLKLTMDFMNKMKLDYKHSKMMSEMVVKDAFRKCPENFQR